MRTEVRFPHSPHGRIRQSLGAVLRGGERSIRADSRSCAWRAGKASKKSETPAGTIDLSTVTDVRAGLAGTKDAGILYIDIPGRTCVTP